MCGSTDSDALQRKFSHSAHARTGPPTSERTREAVGGNTSLTALEPKWLRLMMMMMVVMVMMMMVMMVVVVVMMGPSHGSCGGDGDDEDGGR